MERGEGGGEDRRTGGQERGLVREGGGQGEEGVVIIEWRVGKEGIGRGGGERGYLPRSYPI